MPPFLAPFALALVIATGCAAPAKSASLRVMTYNVHGFGPVAATDVGREQIDTARRLDQIVQRFASEIALAKPDVVALQEAVPETKVAALAKALGMHHRFFPGGWKGKGWPRGIAGALLSRHPILESADCPLPAGVERDDKLFSRSMGRALIDVDGTPVTIFSAHMLPSWKNTTHIRVREIRTLVDVARLDRKAGRTVIVLGDMNHEPDTDEYRCWEKAGLIDAFAAAGKGKGLSCPSTAPTERIDYAWIWGIEAERILTCCTLATGRFTVHRDDPASFALSDHLPVLAEIQLRQ